MEQPSARRPRIVATRTGPGDPPRIGFVWEYYYDQNDRKRWRQVPEEEYRERHAGPQR